MATLEKIRKRSVLLLIVVGAALLAFIIGDFFTSGQTLFGTGTTIAKVGNTKIDVRDFQRRHEEATQQMQQQRPDSKMDPAMMQAQVLQGMIQETLINEEIDRLGITVTDSELSRAMTGADAHPYMLQFARQLGADSPEMVYDYAFNPTKYGLSADAARQLQQVWLNQEKQMTEMLKIQKLQALISGAIVANELDAREYYAANAATSHIVYTSKSFSSMPDSAYAVSNGEIRAAYDKEKQAYRVKDEMRRANFIAVNIVPSAADKAQGQALIDSTMVLLRTTPAIEAVAGDTNFGVNRSSSTEDKITSPVLRSFVKDSVEGAVAQISYIDDEFTVAKLIAKKMAVDSVNIDIIQFQGAAAARDSLLAVLNSGKSVADVAATPGVLDSRADLWQSLAAAPDNITKTRILEAGSGFFIADSAANMATIVRVNSKKAPVAIYDYATVNYRVYPSDATIDKLNDDLRDFMAGITAADSLTAAKAIAAGYTLQPATVTAESYMIGNVPYSRNVVKWVMEAKPGQVSPILQDNQNDYLIVAALNDVVKPGYMPLSDESLLATMTRKARNDKKAAGIIEQCAGKEASDVAGFAALLGTRVDTAEVTFGQMYIPGIGVMESTLLGQVPVTPNDKVTGPVQGNNAMFVYSVYNVDNQGRAYDYAENAARFNQQLGAQAIMQNLIGIMTEKEPVANYTLKFYTE